jgi:hypothetical protein
MNRCIFRIIFLEKTSRQDIHSFFSCGFFNVHYRSMRYFVLFSFFSLITSKQIPLIGLFTSNNDQNRSSSLVINYAIRHFKTIPNLTTELFIQHNEQDIPCDMAIGTKTVFDMISRKPRPLAIFSGSCQTVASAIAETAGMLDMTIV